MEDQKYIDYRREIDGYSHSKLVLLCGKMKKRLDRLSDICDVEDVHRIMMGNRLAQKNKQILDTTRNNLFPLLNARSIKYKKWDKIENLVGSLVTSYNKELNESKTIVIKKLSENGIQVDGNWKLSDCISMLISKHEKNQDK